MIQQSTRLSGLSAALLALCLATTAQGTHAHGDAHSTKHSATQKTVAISAEEHAFGKAGDPKKVGRTITVEMSDAMRFTPAEIRVRQGETIRFIASNKGAILHEMVLGTLDELKAHGELMKKNPGMEHNEPYMAHVQAGGQEELVWQFSKAGEFHFGCLAPGHFEAGMLGKIIVTP